MIHKTIDANTKRPVALILHRPRILLPFLAPPRRKCFRRNDWPGHRMCNGSRFNTTKRRIKIPRTPELAHRHIGNGAKIQVSRRVHVVWLDGQFETVFATKFFQMSCVIFQHQFLTCQTNIPKKTLGFFQAAHSTSAVCRQIRPCIIPAAFFEFCKKILRPVLRPHLPAINMNSLPAVFTFSLSDFFQQFAVIVCKVMIQCSGIELIAFQSNTRLRRRACTCTRGTTYHSKDRPVTGRNIPPQTPVRI